MCNKNIEKDRLCMRAICSYFPRPLKARNLVRICVDLGLIECRVRELLLLLNFPAENERSVLYHVCRPENSKQMSYFNLAVCEVCAYYSFQPGGRRRAAASASIRALKLKSKHFIRRIYCTHVCDNFARSMESRASAAL